MPNHTTNYVEIRGSTEAMADLVDRTLRKNNDVPAFNFNGIIPMPKELDLADGSNLSLGMACFEEKDFQTYRGYPWFPERYPGVESRQQLQDWLSEHDPKTLELGKQGLRNIEQHGHASWYGWANQQWGTKWNAYDVAILYQSDTVLALRFDTAWSAPTPIFHALEDQGYTVVAHSEYEGGEEPDDFGDSWQAFDRRVEVDYIRPEDRYGH